MVIKVCLKMTGIEQSEESDIIHKYVWGIQDPKKGIYNTYTRKVC